MTRLISIPPLGRDFDTSKPTLEALIEAVETGQRLRSGVLKSFVKVEDLVDLGIIRLDSSGKVLMQSQPAFAAPTFQNGWVNYDTSTYNIAGFYRDALNRVYLRGLVRNGTVSTAIFTLPAGFRPDRECIFAVISNSTIGRVDVYPSGQVRAETPSNNTYVSLDGISFVAVQ